MITRRLVATAVLLLGSIASAQVSDPLPYDSIANPLSKLPATNTTVQPTQDDMNLVMSPVRVNQAGYRLVDVQEGRAQFYVVGSGMTTFQVVDLSGQTVASSSLTSTGLSTSGQVKSMRTIDAATSPNPVYKGYPKAGTISAGDVWVGTIPGTVPVGKYRIKVTEGASVPFSVSANLYGMVRDATIKFFGIQRSGTLYDETGVISDTLYSPSWFRNKPSHTWDGWLIDTTGTKVSKYHYKGALSGGWYDCGDHLKETRTQSFTLAMLATTAATMPEKDADHYGFNHNNTRRTDGIPDIVREARWGARFAIKAWRIAGGSMAGSSLDQSMLYLSVGSFGGDHNWWGQPQNQDPVMPDRGGKRNRPVRNEVGKDLGTASLSDWAAGLAFVSRLYRPFDKTGWCDTALKASKDLFELAQKINSSEATSAYSGESKVNDDLALAAVALFWATKDKIYYDAIVNTKGLKDGKGGICDNSQSTDPDKAGSHFPGGFFGCTSDQMRKSNANTDWASVQSPALYAFFKLFLVHKDTASSYGISEDQRGAMAQRTIANMMANLSARSAGTAGKINFPIIGNSGMDVTYNPLSYDSLWYTMSTQQEWVWNRYQMGNLAELYMYWDMTRYLEPSQIKLPNLPIPQWNRDKVGKALINGTNVIFGMNPWDMSMLLGVGEKNPGHPHHRAANPEGKNVPGANYNYRVPTGALYGGVVPGKTEQLYEQWEEYHVTETCSDGSAVTLFALTGLAENVPNEAPRMDVKVLSTSDTLAMVQIDLDKWGTVKLEYGTDSLITSPTAVMSEDTSNTFLFRIHKLDASTKYWFRVTGTDLSNQSRTQWAWVGSATDSIRYNFTTKAQPTAPPVFGMIKACNVTSDSADIMWYTPNGEYESGVKFADSANWKANNFRYVNVDQSGAAPVKFHLVRLYGLKERTTYYFQVGLPGGPYNEEETGCFRTPITDYKFKIYAGQYKDSPTSFPLITTNIVNMEERSFDSLSLRLYLRSTDTLWKSPGVPYTVNMTGPTGVTEVPLTFENSVGAKLDICQAPGPDGNNKPCNDPIWGNVWDWGTLSSAIFLMKPVKLVDSYDPKTNTYTYYMDLPLGPTTMTSQSRIRFDARLVGRSIWPNGITADKIKNYEYVNSFLHREYKPTLGDVSWWDEGAGNPAPTGHDFLTIQDAPKVSTDWTWKAHSVANGDPVDFLGMPLVGKDEMDKVRPEEYVNPYIALYRKGVFVYGFSPDKKEQATKRTVFAMDAKFDAPFDVQNGGTINLPANAPARLTGTLDAYDQLIPTAKGYITEIWLNGVKLSDAERRAALTRNANGTWKVDLPLRLSSGTNKLDVTFFAGPDSVDAVVTNACDEGRPCAFTNAFWYVNNASTKTFSVVDLLDGNGNALRSDSTVSIDESQLIVQVNDPDRDKTAGEDVITVTMKVGSKGAWSRVVELKETGANTGIFRSVPMSVVWDDGSADGDVSKVPMNGVDTVTFSYLDPTMVGDSGAVRAFSKVTFPIDSAWIVDADGDGRADQVSVRFARVLDPAKKEAPDAFRAVFGETDEVRDVTGITTTDNRTFTASLDEPFPIAATSGSGVGGTGRIHVSRNGKLDTASFEELLDRVGPNLISARLRYGSDKDTILVIASEKVTAEDASDLVRRIRGGLQMTGKISGDTIRIVVDTGEILPMVDSAKAGLGLADSLGNGAVAKSPAVLITGGDRPPRLAWYSDVNGDGTVDQVTLVFAPRQLHKIPTFVFRWPDASGALKSYVVAASASDTGLDTVSYVLKGLDSLVTGIFGTGISAADLGQMVDPTYGDTSRFAVEDRVAPVLSTAKLKYSGDEGGLDTLELRFSEPVRVLSGNVVVLNVGGNLVKFVNFAIDPVDARVVRLFVDSTARFSRGDSLSISTEIPAALTDMEGNAATVNGRWARLTYGARPPVYIVEVRNPLQKLDDQQRAEIAKLDASKAVQILVRAPGGEWKSLGKDGQLEAVDQNAAELGTGVLLTVNEGIDGYAYIYDNLGTYLVGMDLSRHKAAWDKGTVPTSASMRTQLWIRWDGRDKKGALASYGVYSMRLVSRRQFEGQGSETATLLNKIYKMGWGKKK